MTKHNLSPAIRMQKARTALLLDHPFFGSLLFRLSARPTTSIETMATDGISLFYNPDFVNTLNAAELIGTLAHEVLHPALQHHTRRGGRNRKRGIWHATLPSTLCSWMPDLRCRKMFSSTIAFAA